MKNQKKINVVLLGLDFCSGNLGCSALAYSFLEVLEKLAKKNNCYMSITSANYHLFSLERENLKVENLQVKYKSIHFYQAFIRVLKHADYVVDFTGGDSFTDIYGTNRFIKESLLKQLTILLGKKLILGPQTIGPFNKKYIKTWAKHILRNSFAVFTRDELSLTYAESLGRVPLLTTDVAFFLQPDLNVFLEKTKVKKIGINISGLLWNGGYTGKNDFMMQLDYKEYCRALINYCFSREYKVYLISHVIPGEDGPAESDYAVAESLKNEFPEIVLAPAFENPMKAKGYLSQMDVFIGARMHATIGAFSMGIPVVAVSYSRKFQGLYKSLEYPYVIDTKLTSLEEAMGLTTTVIEKSIDIRLKVENSLNIVKRKQQHFLNQLESIMFSN